MTIVKSLVNPPAGEPRAMELPELKLDFESGRADDQVRP
jgi:hypothetical protein